MLFCIFKDSADRLKSASGDDEVGFKPINLLQAQLQCWVFHTNANWSYEQAGVDPADSARSLIDAFFEHIGQKPVDPIFFQTRYWRFAAATDPLNIGCLRDAASKIGLCGDWCQMSRFEGAALSGMAMAGMILNMNIGVPQKLLDLNQ